MTHTYQSVTDLYVQKVMDLIHAPAEDRARIEADLKAHLEEGLGPGEDMAALVERMGEPKEVAAGFMAEIPLTYARFWRRLAAFLIDMVLIVFFGGVAGGLFVWLTNLVPQHPGSTWEKVWGGALILGAVILANACIAMILAYFPLLEARFGKTLGKHLFHLRVCMENGLPIGAMAAITRRLSFYFQIFPIDALFVFFNPKKQRGFDILARTIVVQD